MQYFKLVVVNHMIFYHCTKFEVVCLSCSGVIEETLQHHKTFEQFCPSLYIATAKGELQLRTTKHKRNTRTSTTSDLVMKRIPTIIRVFRSPLSYKGSIDAGGGKHCCNFSNTFRNRTLGAESFKSLF